MVKSKNLRQLVNSHAGGILFDTCALIDKIHSSGKTNYKKRRISYIDNKEKFEKILTEIVQQGAKVIITNSVESEYLATNGAKTPNAIGGILDRTKFIRSCFSLNNAFLELSKKEQKIYNCLEKRTKCLKRKNKLSDTDFELLLSVFTIANSRGNSALITNDTKIWETSYKMNSNFGNFPGLGIYCRSDIENFELICSYPKHNKEID